MHLNPSCISGSFPTIRYVTPNPLHNAPFGSRRANCFGQLCSVTCRRICIRVPILFTIGPAVWHLSNIFEFVTPKPPSNVPWGSRGTFFSLCPFRDESVYVCQIWSGSVSGLEAFPDVWIDDPLTPMPLGYQGVHFYLMSIPRLICIRVPNLFTIGPAVWYLSHIF